MIRRKLTGVCCLLSLCYLSVSATPIATSQISYDMSSAGISLSSGTFQVISTDAYSWLQAQDDLGYIDAPDLSGEGDVTAVIPGIDASASASVANGAVIDNSMATTQYGDAYLSSGTRSEFGLYVENAEVITITLDIYSDVNVSTETVNEVSWAFADDYFALYAHNDDGSLNTDPLAGAYVNYELLVVNDESVLPLNNLDKLTLTYDFGAAQGAPFTGFLLLQNTAQTMAEAQNWNVPSNVPEPASLSLIAMGLAMLLPLALRWKV